MLWKSLKTRTESHSNIRDLLSELIFLNMFVRCACFSLYFVYPTYYKHLCSHSELLLLFYGIAVCNFLLSVGMLLHGQN
jgi:hypothetical protein